MVFSVTIRSIVERRPDVKPLCSVRKLLHEWMNEWISLCSPPLIETYREGAVCPSYACLYSSVLSLLQKPVDVRLMSRTVSGNEFQIEGPEVAKLQRDPYRANRLRGIVRSWRAAKRSCWRPVVDDTGVHMSAKHDGAIRRRHLNTSVPKLVLNALSHRQPVKVVTHGVCDVVVLALSYDVSRCPIQHWLERTQVSCTRAVEYTVAIGCKTKSVCISDSKNHGFLKGVVRTVLDWQHQATRAGICLWKGWRLSAFFCCVEEFQWRIWKKSTWRYMTHTSGKEPIVTLRDTPDMYLHW